MGSNQEHFTIGDETVEMYYLLQQYFKAKLGGALRVGVESFIMKMGPIASIPPLSTTTYQATMVFTLPYAIESTIVL
nr:hypothetical protein Iba_chr04eCG10690 [Ipomoea batatas]